MAKKRSRYPISFTTYEDFSNTFNSFFRSIPREAVLDWAEQLDKSVLTLSDRRGHTAAHILASKTVLPEKFHTPDILLLAMHDNEWNGGWTVAHEAASSGDLPDCALTFEILSARCRPDYDAGKTVANICARANRLPERIQTPQILAISDRFFRTAAHDLAFMGKLPKKWLSNKKVLAFSDSEENTVARAIFTWIEKEKRWDLLTPELLSSPVSEHYPNLSVVNSFKAYLIHISGSKDRELECVVEKMPTDTLVFLLSEIKTDNFRLRAVLNGELDRRKMQAAFEIGDAIEDSSRSPADNLYGTGREFW